MEPKKRKTKFALLLVTEKEDGTMKQHAISSAIIEVAGSLLFVAVIIVVCRFIYNSIMIKDVRGEIVNQIVTINNLTDENEALTIENSTLTSKITVLSETVSKKAAVEDAFSQEEVENALPKGFPLSGSATMKEAQEGEAMLVFSSSEGINIITTGKGTVVSINADETYGNKIVLDHGNGYQSIYRNSGEPLVKTGEALGKGYILFIVGEENTELGYQIMQNEGFIDPMQLIDING